MGRTGIRGRRVAGPALLLCALAGLSACGGGATGSQSEIDRFRETHVMCNERRYIKPCQIGPDGRLYEYLPGEEDRRW